jgi:hypothetical protein
VKKSFLLQNIGLNQQQSGEVYDWTALEAYTPLLLLLAVSVLEMFSSTTQATHGETMRLRSMALVKARSCTFVGVDSGKPVPLAFAESIKRLIG